MSMNTKNDDALKIGVSSYSYNRLVKDGSLSQLGVIAQADAMGFDVIEFSAITVPSGETLESFARQLAEESARVGLPIVNYTIAADFINGSNGDLAAEIARVQQEVRIAEILGAPGMRHDAAWGAPPSTAGARSFEVYVSRMADGCRAVTAFAAERGIRTMVENHGHFCQDSARVEALVCAVDHPNFGVLADMGNFICVDEDPAQAFGRLAPYIFHVHAKDFHLKPGSRPWPGQGWALTRGGNFRRGAIIGHGDVPIVPCLRILKQKAFCGVLSIEFEGMEAPLEGIALGQEALRRFVGDIFGDVA